MVGLIVASIALAAAILVSKCLLHIHAKECIESAFLLARKHNFQTAKECMLRAVRMKPSLKRVASMVEFYDLVVTAIDKGRIDDRAIGEIEHRWRVKLLQEGPSIYDSPGLKFLCYGLIILALLIQVINL